MSFTKWLTVALIGVLSGAVPLARAGTISFDVNLDPFQEVPPHNTPAFGDAALTLDTVSGLVTITSGSYADLLGGATAVTINDAAVGANGPVILTLTLDTPGNISGTFSGNGMITAGQITDMEAGNTYINVRDSVFPSGEIRGQIVAATAPEPASAMLMCAGLFMSLAGLLVSRGILASSFRPQSVPSEKRIIRLVSSPSNPRAAQKQPEPPELRLRCESGALLRTEHRPPSRS